MNTRLRLAGTIVAALAFVTAGAFALSLKRIETGEVGVRIGFDKQVVLGELLPGSFNQTMIGDVKIMQHKDVNVEVNDMKPVAKDNSTMKDMDMTIVYNINPLQVSELYSTKNKGFHRVDKDGDTYLMYEYVVQSARNALYKSARQYEALTMSDNRADIEAKVKEEITTSLIAEGLQNSIQVSQVLIRQITPSDKVTESADQLVKAKNELQQKEVEVKTAEAESRRMAALSNQSAQSIEYMKAQAALNISEGIKNGKVQTIIVPSNFTGLMMNK